LRTYTEEEFLMKRIMYLVAILGLSLLTLPQAASAASFTTRASASPSKVAPGKTITITGVIKSAAAATVLVDLEIYRPDGQKTFQKFWDKQSLAAGQSRDFRVTWVVPNDAPSGNYTMKVGIFSSGWTSLQNWNDTAGQLAISGSGSVATPIPPTATIIPATATPIVVPPTATIIPATATPSTARYFATLPPGSVLPSDSECAAAVKHRPENKRANAAYNAARGGPQLANNFFSGDDPRANTQIGPRVTGNFSGTTDEILQWVACKWGVDEDTVRAQAAIESWWNQNTLGDWTTDSTRCAPGHGLGVDGQAGQCPESWGILQNRYPYEQSAWPGIATSTAYNADLGYAIWRTCYEGYEGWLNTVDRGQQYAAGDTMGCMGRWFAGRWHTAAADGYSARVQGYLTSRVWEQANFQEP
jgi:autotransporter family porin